MLGALAVAFALANLTLGRSVGVSALLGLSDVAETAVVTALVSRYVGRRLVDVIDVWRLFAIAAAGAVVSATGVSLVYDAFLDASFWPTMWLTMPSHAASVILLAPVALISWKNTAPDLLRGVELAAQVSLLVTATVITFAAAKRMKKLSNGWAEMFSDGSVLVYSRLTVWTASVATCCDRLPTGVTVVTVVLPAL